MALFFDSTTNGEQQVKYGTGLLFVPVSPYINVFVGGLNLCYHGYSIINEAENVLHLGTKTASVNYKVRVRQKSRLVRIMENIY